MQLDNLKTNILPLFVTALILGVMPCIVGIVELRSNLKLIEKIRNLLPVVLALGILAVFLAPTRATPSSSHILVRCMTLLSIIVGGSGAFIGYSRKSSSILMAVAGLILALCWVLSQPRV
jgi:hypothetical protein